MYPTEVSKESFLSIPRDRTAGFGADRGPDKIALLCSWRLGQNVKLNARDGPTHRQLFHRDRDGGNDAIVAWTPRRRVPSREPWRNILHGRRRSVHRGWCPSLSHRRSRSIGFAKGTAPRGCHAFSARDTADPSGRGVSFHGNHFQDEKGLGTPANKGPAARANSREPLTRAFPPLEQLSATYSSGYSRRASAEHAPIPCFWDLNSF
jgi:hypothetical protein